MDKLKSAKRIAWYGYHSKKIRLAERDRPGEPFRDEGGHERLRESELLSYPVRVLEEFPTPTTKERLASATAVQYELDGGHERVAVLVEGINEWAVYSYLHHVSTDSLASVLAGSSTNWWKMLAKKEDK